MNKKDFEAFRKYLGGIPHREVVGPSGKFTAGIPTLDFLYGGHPILAEYPSLEKELGYYPRKGQVDIQKSRVAAQTGRSLIDLCRELGNPTALSEPIRNMADALRAFRGHHLRAVRHQVPQVFADNAAGTGGEESPGSFLKRRVKIHHLNRREEEV
jgi:hypothetical protein